MLTYDISREKKRFVYMEVYMFAKEEPYLCDILDDRLHRVQIEHIVFYRGLIPIQAAKYTLKMMDISPYAAGYGCLVDGKDERVITTYAW